MCTAVACCCLAGWHPFETCKGKSHRRRLPCHALRVAEKKPMAEDNFSPRCWPGTHPVQKHCKAPHHQGCQWCLHMLQVTFQLWVSLAVELAPELFINGVPNSPSPRCELTRACASNAHIAVASQGEASQRLNWAPAQALTKEERREVLWMFF